MAMKKISLFLLLLTFSLGAFAGKEVEARATALTNGMEKSLALTPEQKTKMYKVVLEKMQTIEKLKLQEPGDEQKKAIMLERRKFITEIKAVLSDTQYQRWQQLRSEQIPLLKKGEKIENAVVDKDIDNALN
jgi:hypothetical protein